jgi:hypothetical protein
MKWRSQQTRPAACAEETEGTCPIRPSNLFFLFIAAVTVKTDLAYGHRQGAHTQPSPEEDNFNS